MVTAFCQHLFIFFPQGRGRVVTVCGLMIAEGYKHQIQYWMWCCIRIVSEKDTQRETYADNQEVLCQECFTKHHSMCDMKYSAVKWSGTNCLLFTKQHFQTQCFGRWACKERLTTQQPIQAHQEQLAVFKDRFNLTWFFITLLP